MTILVFVYVAIFSHFGWNMVSFFLHDFFIGSILQHILLSILFDMMSDILGKRNNDLTDFYRWLWSYFWVILRDGPLIFNALIGVIALRYYLTREVDLSNSALSVSINNPFSSFRPQRSGLRRRRVRRTYRKFRCTLVRFVVFGRIHNRRRRHDYYRYGHGY